MKQTAVMLVALAAAAGRGDVIVKADNADDLNLATSWTNGVAPGAGDIAQWDATVTGANNAALGAAASWSGIRLLDPGGAVTINANTAGASLTLGTNGIDLSATTTNLTINPDVVIAGDQAWPIGGGSALTLLAAGKTGTGSGDITVSRTGSGTATLTVEQNGNTACWRNFTGNWIFTTGVAAVAQGQYGDALGRGTVTLRGGLLAQANGTWNFNNPIAIGDGGGTIESRSSNNGGARYLDLSGGVSGTGPLTFNTTVAGSMGEGFILLTSNTFSGPVTINASAVMRVGGNATTNTLSNANGTNGSIDNVTSITNNGTLRVGRTDRWTLRPDLRITGSGTFRVNPDCAATVSSTLTLADAQRLNLAGPLTLPGSQTVFGLLSAAAETNGDVLGCGTLTIASGSANGFFYYGALSGVTLLQLRIGAQTIAQPNGTASGTGNFLVLREPPASGLALDTGVSTASRKDFGWINDTDDVLLLSSLTGHGAIRGDAGGVAGHPRLITVDQATSTTFNGGIVAGGTNRNVAFTKTGAGSLTLAGFIGHQAGQSGVVDLTVSNGVLNAINDNASPINGTTGVCTTAGSGVLSFSSNALGRGGARTIAMRGGTLRWNPGNAQDVSGRLLLDDDTTAIFDTGDEPVTFASAPALGASGNAAVVKSGAGTLTLAAACGHAGPTIVSNGTLALAGTGSCDASALLLVQTGATLDVTARTDGALAIGAAQSLSGAGTVTGHVNNDGTIRPGVSTGYLLVSGGYAQTNGALVIELGGMDYDQLIVAGHASLGGTLAVVLTNGFTPAVGARFTVLQAFSLGGAFATTNLPTIGTNLWTVDFAGNAVVLTVTNPPSAPSSGYDFFAQQIANPADRGYAGDPDGDGFANLLEYVTGGNPTNTDAAAAMRAARTGGALQMVFTRNTNATDATLVVEGADAVTNDAPWNGILTNAAGAWSGPASFSESGATNPVTVTVTDVTAGTNRFLRLRATRP